MNIQYKNIAIVLFALLIAGCSNQAKIISASEEQVVVKAPAKNFVEAYDLAKKECQKYTTSIAYATDETTPLEEVAFDCTGEKLEPVVEVQETAAAEAAVEQTEEEAVVDEPAVEEEAVPEQDEESIQ